MVSELIDLHNTNVLNNLFFLIQEFFSPLVNHAFLKFNLATLVWLYFSGQFVLYIFFNVCRKWSYAKLASSLLTTVVQECLVKLIFNALIFSSLM